MENELNKHKKSDISKWAITFIVLLLICVTLIGMLLGYITPVTKDDKPLEEQKQESSINDGYQTSFINSQSVKLMSASSMTYSAINNSVSQELIATVLPATASNKKVDWSIAWGDSGNTSNIEDYVTVTVNSDGSTVATVTCFQPFDDDAIITVTTRENGYSAYCIVSFVGYPTDISVSGVISEASDEFYYFGIGQSYTYDVELSSVFNIIGEGYQDLEVSIGASGSVILGYYEYFISSGTSKWYDTSDETVALETLKDNFISASISDNTLTINTIKTIESYYGELDVIDGGRTRSYKNKFRSFVDDCYFTVTITQPDSGLTKVMKIKFDETVVTGVNTENSQLYF